jgi:hypothetical protein
MEPISSIPDPSRSPRLRHALTDSALREELRTTREHAGRLENQIQALTLALSKAREEEQLLERLISVRHGNAPSQPQPRQASNETPAGKRAVRSPAVASVTEILQETRRPLHISELMRLLEERHVRIPGAGRQANLIAALRRDGRIVRPRRGMYGLQAWGLKDLTLTRKVRRRRGKKAGKPSRSHRGNHPGTAIQPGQGDKDPK